MTVNYTADVANGGKFVCFWRVLIRWRGSLYKLIWRDLFCYCVVFIAVYLVHTYVLSPQSQKVLQNIKGYLSSNLSMFPVPFVLSFFVDQVAKKWWHQYQMLPSPDTLAIYANAAIPGKDDQSRIIRRTIVRYAVLSLVLTLRNISVRIKKRFPTVNHVQEAGLILEDERLHYEKLEEQVTANNWMPLVWAANITTHARSLDKISSDHCLRLVINELTAHRDKLGTLVNYDFVTIPLVYTQTMVVVVVSYILITLISHQPIDSGGFSSGSGFAISSLTDFIIYVGLMKVATVMLNPFGEDDDDFEVNAIVDRHLTAAYMIVDEMHEEEPEVVKDAYWDEIVPKELPYTMGSVGDRKLNSSYSDQETRQSTKQTIKRSSRNTERKKRKTSRAAMRFKEGEDNRGYEETAQSNIPKTDVSTKVQSHKYSNTRKSMASTERFQVLDPEILELYDFPDPIPSQHKLQEPQPSTSKQYLRETRF